MYKRKLFYFGMFTAGILLIALMGTAVSSQLTKQNIKQSTIAQSLLFEHQQLSSTSYRMFKQMTDEVIFGQSANQADVRKKQTLISQAIDNIRRLEIEQRQALGESQTSGTIEDTDELERLINDISADFATVMDKHSDTPLAQQEQLRTLLEVTIDNQFREAINAAVTRQTRVVTAINTRIDTLNSAMVWFTFGIAILALPLICYGCFWLFNQFYQPLIVIRDAMNSMTAQQYEHPLQIQLDSEFEQLSVAINKLAKRLQTTEYDVAAAHNKLEAQVEQRTKELTAANVQLTQIDTKRRQFIADVSHELRTPLTIIRGEAQVTLRLRTAGKQDYRDALDIILTQSVHLSRLVDDLLTLTRAEMDELTLQKDIVNPVEVIEIEINKWRRQHAERTYQLNATEAAKTALFLLDRTRVSQVIAILLDNATKYAANSNIIDIVIDTDKQTLLISITDYGDGILPAEIDGIFERFVRYSKDNVGAGLGLPIAKAIVEAHGGNISATSVRHEYTTFTITLPGEVE